MPAPEKINPNHLAFVRAEGVDLSVLDDYVHYLQQLRRGPDQGAASDACGVIDCLRFIKCNQAWISYAYENPHDPSVYNFNPRDQSQYLLRDLNNMAFYLNRSLNQQDCLAELNGLVRVIERMITCGKKQGKLLEVTHQFQYTQPQGSLGDRIDQALIYSSCIETMDNENQVFDLDQLCEGFLQQIKPLRLTAPGALDAAQKFFEPFLNQPCTEDEEAATPLIWQRVVDFIQRKYEVNLKAKATLQNDILSLIRQETVVAKVFSSQFYDNEPESWKFLTDQLADPNKNRPIPRHTKIQNTQRANYWNPLTGKRTHRKLNPVRGAPKKIGDPGYGFTKKTAVTLLPRNGKIILFSNSYDQLGLMFNLKYCHLKNEKYIWRENAASNYRNWLGGTVCLRSIGLQALKNELRFTESAMVGPAHNELLIGLSKEALVGIVLPAAQKLQSRLNALRFQAYVQKKLQVKLPIVWIQPTKNAQVYDLDWQLADLEQVISDQNRGFSTIRLDQNLLAMDLQKMRQDILDEIKGFDPAQWLHNCQSANEAQIMEEIENRQWLTHCYSTEKTQLLQIAIKRNFLKLTEKLLNSGIKLKKPSSIPLNIIVACYKNSQIIMLSQLLEFFPGSYTDPKATLAQTLVAALQSQDDRFILDVISIAKKHGYALSELQKESGLECNFLTIFLQHKPYSEVVLDTMIDWGLDFSFPASDSALSPRPLELALEQLEFEFIKNLLHRMPAQEVHCQKAYLKSVGLKLPFDSASDLVRPNVLTILPDWTKNKYLSRAIMDKQDDHIITLIESIDAQNLQAYWQVDTKNTLLHQLLSRDVIDPKCMLSFLQKFGYLSCLTLKNSEDLTAFDVLLEARQYQIAFFILDDMMKNGRALVPDAVISCYIQKIPFQSFYENQDKLTNYFSFMSVAQKQSLQDEAIQQKNSTYLYTLFNLDPHLAASSSLEGLKGFLQRDWRGTDCSAIKQEVEKHTIGLDTLFDSNLLRHDPVAKKDLRNKAFVTLQQGIKDHTKIAALDKLFWAREQKLFSKHRSTGRLATIGRTNTVIKIDGLIDQSLKEARLERDLLLASPVDITGDDQLIASIQSCQQLLTHDLFRVKAQYGRGAFFSRSKQNEVQRFIELQEAINLISFDAEGPINQANLAHFSEYLDRLSTLSVLDKASINKLLIIKSACDERLLSEPVAGGHVLTQAHGF